jgi:RHS repeat-associated protein
MYFSFFFPQPKKVHILPYKYTAKEQDAETGLYYYGARYLDPKYSMWLSTDPALGEYIPAVGKATIEEAGKLTGMGGLFNHVNHNLYHYAGNNPVKYVDPDGRSSIFGAIAVTIAIKVIATMPSKEEHYNRNKHQSSETYNNVSEAVKNGYDRLGLKPGGVENAEALDNYHEMGQLPDNYAPPSENNKYVKKDPNNPEASFELIFDSKGELVTDSKNAGTYNFSDPGGVKGKINHFIKDMLPYYIWGNNETDKKTTSIKNRILGDYKGPIPDPSF